MAYKGADVRILIDEFDFSGESMSVEIATTVAALQTTGFQATGETFTPGLSTGSVSLNGYYEGAAAGTYEAEINSRIGTSTAVYKAVLLATSETACPTYVLQDSWASGFTLTAPVDGLITLASEWPAPNFFTRGLRIQRATLSATGEQTAVDFGAQGTAGGFGFLFVTAITGTATGATIDIESSSTEGGAYVSEGTFTFSAVGVYKITLSGTIDRWLRLNVTSLGGATDFSVVAIGAVSGVTY